MKGHTILASSKHLDLFIRARRRTKN
jgi:hypothetical protein